VTGMQKILFFIVGVLIIGVSSCGCLGFFTGYTEKAQEFTSADYSISQYKFFIDKYNAIRSMGAMIQNIEADLEDFKELHPASASWSRTESNNYEDLRFTRTGYIAQYNGFVQEYNARMRDLTTNQMWMKPQNFPDRLEMFSPENIITTENPELSYR
jgi:hypothetical protein